MARRVEMTSRDWDGGPPAVWQAGRMVLRILLVIGLVNLIAFTFGAGHGSPFPLIFIPFAFMWFLSGPLFGRGRGRRRRDGRDVPGEWERDDRLPTAGGSQSATDGQLRLEAELTTARRRISELETQLQWQARLLESTLPARPDTQAQTRAHAQTAPPAPARPHDQAPLPPQVI